MGAWIEIRRLAACPVYYLLHPAWVHGLKLKKYKINVDNKVAPRVGAWIEIYLSMSPGFTGSVAPRVGAWIEILFAFAESWPVRLHPAWVHGLK